MFLLLETHTHMVMQRLDHIWTGITTITLSVMRLKMFIIRVSSLKAHNVFTMLLLTMVQFILPTALTL